MARIAVFTVIHNRTPEEFALTRKSIRMLNSMAGIEFDHYVADNGSIRETQDWLEDEYAKGRIFRYYPSDENLGQHIAANILLDWICEGDYDWVLRWDSDAMPRSRRFLKKLTKYAQAFKDAGIWGVYGPKISKLKNPRQAIMAGDDIGFKYEVFPVLHGACRLHHLNFFLDWRFNKFGALAHGEAAEVADRCYNQNIAKIRIPSLKVEHASANPALQEDWERTVSLHVGYGL